MNDDKDTDKEKLEILNNLDKWTLEKSGDFSTHGFLVKKTVSLNSLEEREIREAIVEKIKQNPSEWRIEKINVNYQDGPYPYGRAMRNFYYDIFLIHQSAQVKQKSVKGRHDSEEKMLSGIDFGKMHYQRGFSDLEREEIENALKTNSNNLSLEEWLAKYQPKQIEETNQKTNNWGWGKIILISGGIVIVCYVLWKLGRWIKSVNK